MGSIACLYWYVLFFQHFLSSPHFLSLLIFIASALCPLSQLQSSIGTLMISSHNLNVFNGNIIPGGWVLFRCRPGLNLNAFSGSLNVTCQTNGQWTTFPVCA